MSSILKSPVAKIVAVVAVLALVAAAAWYFLAGGKKTIHAEFTSTNGIYKGDSVRVLGVEIGNIAEISTEGGVARVTMTVDPDVAIPEDANALLVAQSLVAERFIQLTPVHEGGPELQEGAVIPLDRTAVPVEWDAVKEQLMALSTALGPNEQDPDGALGTFVDATDEMLDGNGRRFNSALDELSRTMSVMSDGREDLFSTVRNLQLFVTALSNSEEQIVSFGGRLASVSEVLADQTDELETALVDLDAAVTDIDRFMAEHSDRVTGGVDRLGQATEVLRERRGDVENLLHVAPTATANFYNIYRPYQGTLNGVLALNQMGSPIDFICASITALENPTAAADANLCATYLGPFLNTLTSNYPYGMAAPPITPTAEPHQIIQGQKPGTATPDGVQPASAPPAELTSIVTPGTDLTGLLQPTGGGR